MRIRHGQQNDMLLPGQLLLLLHADVLGASQVVSPGPSFFGQFRIVAIYMGKDLEGKVCMQHVCG